MTTNEAIKALRGEPMRDRQGIVTNTTGVMPAAYTVLYQKVLAETVEVDPEAMSAAEEGFIDMFEPL